MGRKIKIIAGVFLLASIISYFLIQANEKQFDATAWHASPLTRYKMAKAIVESNMLIDKTKTEVITLLGNTKPSTLHGKEHLVFALGTAPSFFEAKPETLVVIFENNKAIKVMHSFD
ncbi:MAG: hypothetical protein ACPG6B_00375 [Oceanihabitans sp.]